MCRSCATSRALAIGEEAPHMEIGVHLIAMEPQVARGLQEIERLRWLPGLFSR